MKKLSMLLLALTLVLTACGGNDKKGNTDTKAGKQTEKVESNQEAETENMLIETEKYSAKIGEAKIEDGLLILPIDYKSKTDDSKWMLDLKLSVIQNGKELEQDSNYDIGLGTADPKNPSLKYAYKGAKTGEATVRIDDKETNIIIK